MSCACMTRGSSFCLGFFFFAFTGLIEQLQGDGKSWCDESYSSLGETPWTGNSIQGAYRRECCTLIMIMKTKPGCKYSNQRRPGLTRGGYLYTGFVVLNTHLDI